MPVNESQLAVGAIHASTAERKLLASRSGEYTCPTCKVSNKEIAEGHMKSMEESDGSELKKASEEMNLQFNKPKETKEGLNDQKIPVFDRSNSIAPQKEEPLADKQARSRFERSASTPIVE